MEIGFTSTYALNARMRQTSTSLQTELARRQNELATGKHHDSGLELGSLTAHLVQIRRQLESIDQTRTLNGLLSNRMEVMQNGLAAMLSTGQAFNEQMIVATSGNIDRSVLQAGIASTFSEYISYANTTFRGEYVFSGINTDVPSLGEYAGTPPTPARAAVHAAFLTEFGFAITDPAVGSIEPADIMTFLEGAFADLFDDANWQSLWSGASSRGMRLKYSVSEVAELPVNANDTAFRQTTAAMVAAFEFTQSQMADGTLQQVASYAVQMSGQAVAGFGSRQGELGIVEQRVADARERMEYQETILRNGAAAMEEVDSFETATRINELLVNLEASYSVTARIQALSIMNYL